MAPPAQASLLDALPDLFEALVVLHRRITDLAGQVVVVDPSAFLIFSSRAGRKLGVHPIKLAFREAKHADLNRKCWTFVDKHGKLTNNNCDARHVICGCNHHAADWDDLRNWIVIQEEWEEKK